MNKICFYLPKKLEKKSESLILNFLKDWKISYTGFTKLYGQGVYLSSESFAIKEKIFVFTIFLEISLDNVFQIAKILQKKCEEEAVAFEFDGQLFLQKH
jgi:hypothetical protein